MNMPLLSIGGIALVIAIATYPYWSYTEWYKKLEEKRIQGSNKGSSE